MSPSMFTFSVAALSLLGSYTHASYLQYSAVPGIFLQDANTTSPDNFDYTATNFGLIDRPYGSDAAFDPTGTKTQWERFENLVASLNAASDSSARYAVLYLGRHGEGYHNAAETFYGTPAWNCYWSEQNGNGSVRWDDALVTPNGVEQAQIAHDFWASQIANQKQSLPQGYYTSPMSRCLETAEITFEGLVSPFTPIVKEYLREGISMHTCDRRSSRSYIEANYPGYTIEAGFTEADGLWTGLTAETKSAQDARSKIVLDSIFSADARAFLSITSHSGEISSLLRVLGHRTFSLRTGAVIPVLVKIETVAGTAPVTSVEPWEAQATCTVPPITSLADVGCVCPSPTSSPTSLATSEVSFTPTSSSATTLSTATSIALISSISSRNNSTTAPTSTSSVQMTTSTVYTTAVSTVTKCAATVTDCPLGSVVTSTIALYTTVCPVSTVTVVPMTTSVAYTTKLVTVTACPAPVTNCPVGKVTTSTYALYTTVCPVTNATVPAGVSTDATTVPSGVSTDATTAPSGVSTTTTTTVPTGAQPTITAPAPPYASTNGTTAVSKNVSISAGPIAKPSTVPSSGSAQIGSAIAMIAGFSVFALWL